MRYYKRFSNCYPVCGYRNFAVYDISRKAVFEIEKQTFELLGLEIISEQLLQSIPNKQFNELLDKEIIFQCNFGEDNLFPSIETCWFSPFSIISCIIDWEKNSQYDIIKGLEQLCTIGCKTLQLRFGSGVEENQIFSVLDCISSGNIRSVEMVLCFDDNIIRKITKEFEFVVSILAYSANQTKILTFNSCQVVLTKEIFYSSAQCGIVSPSYFICNSDFFFESINHNTCLNRKISIDSNGNIKNCPSCIQSYGNIKDTTLDQALKHPDFKKFWNITKDQIDVCKHCEFRYMCTDCRVFIKDTENPYSQPAKCTYNPYIAKWQGVEGYLPVEECGTYTRESGFIPNHQRIEELNLEIWGE